MKRNEDGTVELTEAETVVSEWHASLLDTGYSHAAADEQILLVTPTNGMAWKVLADMEFRKYLHGVKFWGPLAKNDHTVTDEPPPRIGFLDDDKAVQYEAEVRRLGPDLFVITAPGIGIQHLVSTQDVMDDDYLAFLDEDGSNPAAPKELRASAGAQSVLVDDLVEQGEA